jgi:hypothetical protein
VSEQQMLAYVKDLLISIPLELYRTMGKPRWLILSPESDSYIFIYKTDKPLFWSINTSVMDIVRKLAKKKELDQKWHPS